MVIRNRSHIFPVLHPLGDRADEGTCRDVTPWRLPCLYDDSGMGKGKWNWEMGELWMGDATV